MITVNIGLHLALRADMSERPRVPGFQPPAKVPCHAGMMGKVRLGIKKDLRIFIPGLTPCSSWFNVFGLLDS